MVLYTFIMLCWALAYVDVSWVTQQLEPSPEELAAVSLLEQPLPMPGSNAFSDIWLMAYAMPDAERSTVLAADIQQFESVVRRNADLAGPDDNPVVLTSSAEGRYPKTDSQSLYCPLRAGSPCLEHVRNNREPIQAALRRDQFVLDALRNLPKHGHYHSLVPNSPVAPVPQFTLLGILPTAAAMEYLEGRTKQALDSTCQLMAANRRLAEHSDDMLAAMVMNGQLLSNLELLAQMLAGLPSDYPLADSCLAALQPELAAPDLCRAIQGEYRAHKSLYQRLPHAATGLEALGMRLAYAANRTIHRSAVAPAHYCSPELRTALASKERLQQVNQRPVQLPSELVFSRACIGNWAGCILAEIALPDWNTYLVRRQQAEAMVELMRVVLVEHAGNREALLASQSGQDSVKKLAAFSIGLEYDNQGRGLCLAYAHTATEQRKLALPWPGSGMNDPAPPVLSCITMALEAQE